MKKQIISMAALALGAGALAYAVYTVEPPGYCRNTQSFLSDDDFIKSALREEAKKGAFPYGDSEGAIYRLRTEHPSCCKVDRTPRTLLERRVGINTVDIDLHYEVSPKLAYDVFFRAGACGEMRTRRAVETTSEDLPVTAN